MTDQALIQRVNRWLRKAGQKLKKTRRGKYPSKAFIELGEYHMIDLERNILLRHHVDPQALLADMESDAPNARTT